jgi:hypothetical protein
LLLIERRLTTARGVSVRCDVFEGDKFEMAWGACRQRWSYDLNTVHSRIIPFTRGVFSECKKSVRLPIKGGWPALVRREGTLENYTVWAFVHHPSCLQFVSFPSLFVLKLWHSTTIGAHRLC